MESLSIHHGFSKYPVSFYVYPEGLEGISKPPIFAASNLADAHCQTHYPKTFNKQK